MASPKNPEVFFVGIQNAEDLRRSILESVRDSITFLTKYESFLKLRKEKNQAIADLKKVIKEINANVLALKKKLPESDINRRLGNQEVAIEREILGIAEEKKNAEVRLSKEQAKIRLNPKKSKEEVSKEKEKKKEEKSPHEKEMEKLEFELKNIEHKLRGLE